MKYVLILLTLVMSSTSFATADYNQALSTDSVQADWGRGRDWRDGGRGDRDGRGRGRGQWECKFTDLVNKGHRGYSRWDRREAYREAEYRCERDSFVPRTCQFASCKWIR